MTPHRLQQTVLLTCALTATTPKVPAAPQDPDRLVTDRPGVELLTVPAEDDAFTFAVFGDRTGGPVDGVTVLADAVRDVNLVEPDLVMTVGDLINGYNTTPQWLAQMTEYTEIMDGLTCPWYPVAGNHDVYWRGDKRPQREHEANYEAHFGPLWYAMRHKDCWFLCLYTDEPNPQTGERNFSKPECQRMSPEQFAFLDETLKRAAGARHVFVFLHHPRWHGGNYGDDWERVHERLATAGNVTAVFAGHIHRMVHSGVRDGIEYMTLATVGGHQSGIAPQAGYLHHWNLVTVREDHISVATFPVGAAIDPRTITAEVSDQVRTLASDLTAKVLKGPSIGESGLVDGEYVIELTNPLPTPIEVQVQFSSEDSRWMFVRDHHHLALAGHQSAKLRSLALHSRAPIDQSLRLPSVQLQADYTGEDLRVSLPARSTTLPLPLDYQAPQSIQPGPNLAYQLDGSGDVLALSSQSLALPQGPFTLECWMRAETFTDRTGLLCKTENSEYGIFVGGGKLEFIVHLSGKYIKATSQGPILKLGQWHHVAGVFDGQEVRVYLDGQRLAATPGQGQRTLNELPLLIGADVDSKGLATSHFKGSLDDVHLSSTARYTGERFAPPAHQEGSEHSLLLLRADGLLGPWALDRSPANNHPSIQGRPGLAPR